MGAPAGRALYLRAAGVRYGVREFVLGSFIEVGIGLRFEGSGFEELAVVDEVDLPHLSAATRGGDAGYV